MAFSDDDVAREAGKLSRVRTYDYGSIDGPRDPLMPDKGLESWRVKLRRQSQDQFTLKGVRKLVWRNDAPKGGKAK